MKYSIMAGYGELKKIGTLSLDGNKLTCSIPSDKRMELDMLVGPYNANTDGSNLINYIQGRFARSTAVSIVPGE